MWFDGEPAVGCLKVDGIPDAAEFVKAEGLLCSGNMFDEGICVNQVKGVIDKGQGKGIRHDESG